VSKTDWMAVKADYISTSITMRELADKYGVTFSAISKRAMKEKWTAERAAVGIKVEKKVKQKIVSLSAKNEVERLSRLMAIGDDLADKLHQASRQLGAYTVVKRKGDNVIDCGGGVKRLVEDTEEIAVPGESIINTSDAKRIASALKDLRDVMHVDADEKHDGDGEGLLIRFEHGESAEEASK